MLFKALPYYDTIQVFNSFLYFKWLKSFNSVCFLILCSVRLEQGTVTSLVEEKGTIKGVHYKTKTSQELTAYAPLTIVCDGCFSNLRHSLCNPNVSCYKITREFV